MTEHVEYGLLMLILGLVVLLSVPLRQGLRWACLPGMVGFVALGAAVSGIDRWSGVLTPAINDQIEFLAQLGIVALLFRVGLESDPGRLVAQLGRAVAIWLPNVVLPGLAAFALILVWPGFGTVPAFIMGIAATATSIGVSVAPWEEAGALDTADGALMLDVAELDDLSAVVLLGIVFAVAPQLRDGPGAGIGWDVVLVGAGQVLKIAVFSALCYAFSRLAERRLSAKFADIDPA